MAGEWVVYLIRTARGRIYTGITTDVERRFAEHRDDPGGRGAKFFLADRPLAVIYREALPDRGAALRREQAIKRLSRAAKERLVETGLAL